MKHSLNHKGNVKHVNAIKVKTLKPATQLQGLLAGHSVQRPRIKKFPTMGKVGKFENRMSIAAGRRTCPTRPWLAEIKRGAVISTLTPPAHAYCFFYRAETLQVCCNWLGEFFTTAQTGNKQKFLYVSDCSSFDYWRFADWMSYTTFCCQKRFKYCCHYNTIIISIDVYKLKRTQYNVTNLNVGYKLIITLMNLAFNKETINNTLSVCCCFPKSRFYDF